MSKESVDFIQRCLSKDPKFRLGSNGDVEEVLAHPWFKDLNIPEIFQKKMKPPFVPKLDDKLDLKFFDKKFTKNQEII